ncbi:3'-5' exonuclease [Celeribacter arenosi]|uniref:DNA-directed DNA polymerase n=1 Tax=Celeribacter arenosi TaxID=792649 RepID=A0ABP7K3M3_9RHOB
MKIENWSLRLRVFLFFAFLAAASIVAICAGLYVGFQRLDSATARDGFVFAGALSSFAILGLTVWIWLMFDENVAKPIQNLAGAMLARAHADVDEHLDEGTAKYLGDLAPAARAVTENLSATRNKLAETVAAETTRLVEEKARLAALAAEMPHGVVLLSGSHRIAFYNGAAAEILDTDHAPGLDHPVFDFLRPGPILSAYNRLCAGEGGAGHVLPLTISTVQGGTTLAARMRLMRAPSEADENPAYVLTLDDVTADLETHAEREALLSRLFARLRPSIAAIQTLNDARSAVPKDDIERSLEKEINTLFVEVTGLADAYEVAKADWWPMDRVLASDLCEALSARLQGSGIALTADVIDPMELTLDSIQIVALLNHISERLTGENARGLSFLISRDDVGGAMLALGWSGEPLSVDTLESWLDEPLESGLANLTGRVILDAHGTDIWPEFGRGSRAVLKLPIRDAHRIRKSPTKRKGSATYDFDLLSKTPPAALLDTPLTDLTYVVFDTETTGLLPSQGDEICQVAALRVVNGRVVETERLDKLVNPGRPIPAMATEVHHITDEMVRHAPRIDVVGRELHSFARGSVLVAHNAPFDLEFLRRHEDDIGRSFSNPVIDTVLLSAIVFGQSAEHTLDAISVRLGVTIPPEARHTAMGDTIATADCFNKMLRMASERGLLTFGDLLAEMRKHKRLLKDANADHIA